MLNIKGYIYEILRDIFMTKNIDIVIKKGIFSIIFILVFGIFPALAEQQIDYSFAGTTGVCFQLPIGARGTAMGSGMAANTQGIESIIWNPAGLTAGNQHEILTDFARIYDEFNIATIAYKCQLSVLAIGVLINHTDFGSVERFDLDAYNNPVRTNQQIAPFSLIAELGLAKALSPDFSIGVNTKYLREDLIEKVFQHVAVDIGFQIHTGFDGFKIGAIVKNIGRKFAGFSLPFSTQMGVSYKSSIGMFKADELTIVLDSVISQVQAIGVILGLEYSLLDMLHIRLGYNRNEAQAKDDFLKGFSVGMGFNLRQYSINYSFSPDSILGSGHRVTLQAKFGPEKTWRKKAKAVGKKKKSEYLHDFMR